MLPEYGKEKFKCPSCDTVATQDWFTGRNASRASYGFLGHLYLTYRSSIADWEQDAVQSFLKRIEQDFGRNFSAIVPNGFSVASCASCDEFSLWVESDIVYPRQIGIVPPNVDLDVEIKDLYIEAASIYLDSPKGSTALLRLALQLLLKQVGKSGKNINSEIKELVADGLSPKIQKALDLLRVIGNNAVHPGQIDLDDNSDVAHKLFGILNFIADELISKPKELDELYDDLIPSKTQGHIKDRDGT